MKRVVGVGSGSSGGGGYETVAGSEAVLQVLIFGEFGFGTGKIHLKLAELVLEERDDSNAAVDGIAEAHVSLVGKRVDGVLTLVGVQLVKQFGDVACPEHFVNVCKLLRLVRWEVGCKYTLWLALASQEFARRAWRIRRRR